MAVPFTKKRTSTISVRLVQPELEGERVQRHVAAAEARLGHELKERLLRVGALLQHRVESQLDQGAIDHALAAHIGVDLLRGKILAQIDDQGRAAGLEDAMHFIERVERPGEILECRAADDEIDAVAWK